MLIFSIIYTGSSMACINRDSGRYTNDKNTGDHTNYDDGINRTDTSMNKRAGSLLRR